MISRATRANITKTSEVIILIKLFNALQQELIDHPPQLEGSKSVLAFLYEAYSQVTPIGYEQIKTDFETLYQAMSGMELHEMDRILDPLCTFCRDHERAGFIAGVTIGIHLAEELTDYRHLYGHQIT